MIPEDDRGLLLGDGLFETILVIDGQPLHFEAHLARMAAGCAVIGLAAPDGEHARRLAEAALAEAPVGPAALRLTLTAGQGRGLERPEGTAPRLIASAGPLRLEQGPARLAVSSIRRNETSPASRLKSLAYLDNVLARRAARAAGADEALLLNTRGEIACAAAANLFWIADGRLFTPALECGVLAGLTRARVLATAAGLGIETAEVAVGIEALRAADGMFLTNSLMGLRQVSALDGRPIPASPLAERLSNLCR